jgi:hypothetical protein
MAEKILPGLSRLLEVLREHEVPFETLPAGQTSPQAGQMISGMPVDSLLATAFSQVGKLVVGRDDWLLLRCDDEMNGYLEENKDWYEQFPHDFWPDHFRLLMIFGSEMLYRFATVPVLAAPDGLQPVVHVDPYEQIYALPVASDLNRFFDTYSHYVEMANEDPDYKTRGVSQVVFPWHVPELIGRDRPLVEMIKAGRFDPWMYERNKHGRRDEDSIATTREWINKVLRSADG